MANSTAAKTAVAGDPRCGVRCDGDPMCVVGMARFRIAACMKDELAHVLTCASSEVAVSHVATPRCSYGAFRGDLAALHAHTCNLQLFGWKHQHSACIDSCRRCPPHLVRPCAAAPWRRRLPPSATRQKWSIIRRFPSPKIWTSCVAKRMVSSARRQCSERRPRNSCVSRSSSSRRQRTSRSMWQQPSVRTSRALWRSCYCGFAQRLLSWSGMRGFPSRLPPAPDAALQPRCGLVQRPSPS